MGGASETMKDFFFSNMSERAGKLLKEEMSSMGPVRLKDVEEAQGYIVSVAKDLAAIGCYEISLGDTIGVGTPVKAQAMLKAPWLTATRHASSTTRRARRPALCRDEGLPSCASSSVIAAMASGSIGVVAAWSR